MIAWIALAAGALGVGLGVWGVVRGERNRERLRRLHREARGARGVALASVKANAADAAHRALAEAGREPALPVRFAAQETEDIALWELFDRSLGGRFLEVGAYDGVTLSVTYALEALGWEGILVEALPEEAAACREHRPRSIIVEAALGERAGRTEFMVAETRGGARTHSYASVATRSADEARAVASAATRKIEVEVRTLTGVLDDCLGEGERLDVLSIDVEGGEESLLRGMDFQKHRPRAVLIEDNAGDHRLRTPLEDAGYTLAGRVYINDLYIDAREHDLLERAGRVAYVDPIGG